MKQTIMVICNQTENRDELQATLVQAELAVTQANQTHDAMEVMAELNPGFIFLDFDVDNSADFLRFISHSFHLSPPPYILIAATFFDGPGQAEMYNLGADACIVKPIDPKEVVALINAVLRREQRIARLGTQRLLPCIEHKDLIINPASRTVTMRGEPVALTTKEFDILYLLADNAGVVLKKEEIYEMVWKVDHKFASANVSDHIHTIRRKLGVDGKDHDYIQTVYHIGYRFDDSI